MSAFDEEVGAETPPQPGDSGGQAGGSEPSLDAQPETEQELKDYGPPADADRDAEPDMGESGGEEGISPWAEEGYSSDPEGPTTHTGGSEA